MTAIRFVIDNLILLHYDASGRNEIERVLQFHSPCSAPDDRAGRLLPIRQRSNGKPCATLKLHEFRESVSPCQDVSRSLEMGCERRRVVVDGMMGYDGMCASVCSFVPLNWTWRKLPHRPCHFPCYYHSCLLSVSRVPHSISPTLINLSFPPFHQPLNHIHSFVCLSRSILYLAQPSHHTLSIQLLLSSASYSCKPRPCPHIPLLSPFVYRTSHGLAPSID